MSSNGDIEHRVAVLEEELARLKRSLGKDATKRSWVDQISGTFKDDSDFDEIVDLGREIRKSQLPETHG